MAEPINPQAAVDGVMRLVEQWRALQTVGEILSGVASLENHRQELAVDIARLRAEQSAEALKLATAQEETAAQVGELNRKVKEARASLKELQDAQASFLTDAEAQRKRAVSEQQRLDAALAEARAKLRDLAKTAAE